MQIETGSLSRKQSQKDQKRRMKFMSLPQPEGQVSAVPAPVGGTLEGSLPTAELGSQAQKKLAKEKRKRELQLRSEEALSTAPANGHLSAEPGRKEKKKKKKANAAAEALPQPKQGMEPAVPDDDATLPDAAPEKKKQKKKKGPTPTEAPSMAQVGDRELATSGKPIQKALYSEHPAVAGLSDAEVDAWRSERSTVVTGCDIRPVPAFDQAGQCRLAGPSTFKQ